jgi:ribA/ribD-fused uncharacterized protein
VSRTLPGADVRGFYAALGVELPGWAHTEAPVRCFADPDAHAHGDRDASCSVNLRSGAFKCHGCGAKGGAFDAALAMGRSPGAAFDLKVVHGLAERDPRRDTSRASAPASTRDTSPRSGAQEAAPRRRASARPLESGAASLPVTGPPANRTASAGSGHEQSRRTVGLGDEPSRGDTAGPSASRWRRERWDEPGTIYFWSGRRGRFEVFSNFAATPFAMPAWHDRSRIVEFPSGEHAFQAAKARTVSDHEHIRLAASPLEAKRAGRRVALPGDWEQRRGHVMLAVVRAKFAVPELRELLLSTDERVLAEDSPYDPVWGCRDRSGGYTGENLLGRALMRVRNELRHADRDAPVSSVSAHDVRGWAQALRDDVELLARLAGERGWKPDTLRKLGVGFDGERITVPITDDQNALQGVLRLRVDASQRPKVLAAPGTRLGLIPHPSSEAGPVLLVEGPSDMLAARSAGLAAIAVPGTHAWRAEWARGFAGREVTIVMDADRPGRDAAARIARDLDRQSAGVRIVDLAPGRDDGYDLSDWLKAGNPADLVSARWYTSEAYTRIARPSADVWTVRSAGGERTAGERSQQAMRAAAGPTTQPGAVAGSGWQTGGSTQCRTF